VEFILPECTLSDQFTYLLPDTASLYLVTDGSAIPTKYMTYGWVWALADETILATGKGRAPGPISSLRAEAYALLSGVVFLKHLHHYLKIPLTRFTITMVTDSANLITRLTTRRKYPQCYPNETLRTNWDVIEQLHIEMQHLPHIPTLEWVRGHQDKNRPLVDLTPQARLNVQADRLAASVRLCHPHTPLSLPSATAVLIIASQPIWGSLRGSRYRRIVLI
jgi:hypothetical protein